MRFSLFCGVALAALQTAPLTSFGGTFSASPLTSNLLNKYDGSCSDSTSYSGYQLVNYTFPSAGVRVINTYNLDYIGVIRNGSSSNLTSLCDHGVLPLIQGSAANDYSGLYPFGGWFDANVTYTFILAGSSGDKYVAEFWDGLQGQTVPNNSNVSTTNRTFLPLYVYGSSGTCYQSSSPSLYDTQVVTINDTGVYNVFLAFAQNIAILPSAPSSSSPYFSVFRGDVSGANLSATDCSSPNFVGGTQGGSGSVLNFSMWLQGNQSYTFVVVSDQLQTDDATYYGHYSLTVSPAHRYQFSKVQTFPRPTNCNNGQSTCNTDNTATATNFALATFQIPPNSPFYIRATENDGADGSSRDLAFYLYSGGNNIPLACGPIGTTCYAKQDTLTGGVFSSPASEWTLVATSWYDYATFGSDASFDLYVAGAQFSATSGSTSAPTSPTSSPPSTHAPTPQGYTYAPTAPTTHAPSSPPTTRAPTPVGYTYAPTTIAPTPEGYTYAPTSKVGVNSGALFHPGLATVAVLSGFLWL